jgi:hypothetical protein
MKRAHHALLLTAITAAGSASAAHGCGSDVQIASTNAGAAKAPPDTP